MEGTTHFKLYVCKVGLDWMHMRIATEMICRSEEVELMIQGRPTYKGK